MYVGADPNLRYDDNRPPRHLAAEGWHHGIVRRTLYAPEQRCSAQLQGLIIDTPLHLSWQENAGKGRTVQLNFTLCRWTREKNGADKVAFNDRGDTPLFYSSCCGYTQAVTGRGTHLGRPCQHEHGHKHGSQWFRSLLTHAARGEILETLLGCGCEVSGRVTGLRAQHRAPENR